MQCLLSGAGIVALAEPVAEGLEAATAARVAIVVAVAEIELPHHAFQSYSALAGHADVKDSSVVLRTGKLDSKHMLAVAAAVAWQTDKCSLRSMDSRWNLVRQKHAVAA
jgi:hypothetical protein